MREAKDSELKRVEKDPISEAFSDITECLADLLSSSTSGEKSRGRSTARKFMRTLAPEMSESNRIRALFASLEASTLSQTPELGLLSLPERKRVLAAFELARRYRFYSEAGRKSHLYDMDALEKEALQTISPHWRNRSSEWLGFVPVYPKKIGNLCVAAVGVRTHVNIDPMELFARILVLRPRAIFLFHNHPSGDLTPSAPDYELTERVDEMCKKLGLKLLSHWIVSGPHEKRIP
jgi:hypothetical protein